MSSLRFDYAGAYEDLSIEAVDDPDYDSVQVTRKGDLLLTSLATTLRFVSRLHAAGVAPYVGLGGQLSLLLLPHTRHTLWSRPYGSPDAGASTPSDFGVGIAGMGIAQAGAYLNDQRTLDLGAEFGANRHAWTLMLSISASLTGWSGSSSNASDAEIMEN